MREAANPYADIRIVTQDMLMDFQRLENRNRGVLTDEMRAAKKAVSALSRAAADAVIKERSE